MTHMQLAYLWALVPGPCLLAIALRGRVMRKVRPAIAPDWRAPVVIKPRPRKAQPL